MAAPEGDAGRPPSPPVGITGLSSGDAVRATWEFVVTVKQVGGGLDFGVAAVRGKRGDVHIGLAWGELPDDDTFLLFRGAELRLDAIDPAVVLAATEPGRRLVGHLGLTEINGQPRCATVRPPAIAWTAEPVTT